MVKKILLLFRIPYIVIFCGLVIYFHFADNWVGESLTLFSSMFINLLLSVLKDNITKDESEGDTKNRQLSKKEKIFDIVSTIIVAILFLFCLLYQRLNINVDLLYVIVLPAIAIWVIISTVINYKRNR